MARRPGAPKGNKNAVGNRGGGRYPIYDPLWHPKKAKTLALLRWTDTEIADFFEITTRALNQWKEQHIEFASALSAGREGMDGEVVRRLADRALGFKAPATKIFRDGKTGEIVKVPYVEHYPPDVAAAIFWLTNRHPDKWRRVIDQGEDGAGGSGANGGKGDVVINIVGGEASRKSSRKSKPKPKPKRAATKPTSKRKSATTKKPGPK